MEQRREFLALAASGEVGMAELCRRFGISRKTGYRLRARFATLGEAACQAGSRRPLTSPGRTPAAIEQAVLDLRSEHPAWGGRKLAHRLRRLGHAAVPAPSTITAILHRHGHIEPEPDRQRGPWQRFERAAPNELWQMDYKGHFATSSGIRCHALTVLDDHCRYALGLQACANETAQTVQGHLLALFRRYGLPQAMLADNGSPWGGPSGEITRLGVWLMRLGIGLHHGRAYHPQTQGKDERFHQTLDVELLQMKPLADLEHAQVEFDRWREIYNHQRPHEALGYDTPADRYRPSPRSLPEHLPEPVYYPDDITRRVRRDGSIRFQGRVCHIGQAFAGQRVALRLNTTAGLFRVFYSRFPIKELDLNTVPRPASIPSPMSPNTVSPLSPV